MGGSNTPIEVVLRDLDVLLRKKLGERLVVESFTTSSLVALGENYGSTMLKVDAVIRRDGRSSEPEKLHLVAKMAPPTEYQKKMFDSPFTFPKEIYMFQEIVPAYKALEREYGIPESEVFDPLPELFGSRLSLEEGKDKFDNDAVLLMENLRPKNYGCGNRTLGVDLAHAKMVVEAMARFHSLGIAMKLKKPALFKEMKIRTKHMNMKVDVTGGMTDFIMKDARKVPDLHPYLSKIEKVLQATDAGAGFKAPAEPWGTIAHADLWINNVLLRDDASGNPVDVKFIDFQNYQYLNPMRDLIFFIFSSCRNEVRASNVDELVDLYYEKLTSHLANLDCNMNSFSRESFDKQIADAASLELQHCNAMARVVVADEKRDGSVTSPEMLFKGESTAACRERIAENILTFLKKNWI